MSGATSFPVISMCPLITFAMRYWAAAAAVWGSWSRLNVVTSFVRWLCRSVEFVVCASSFACLFARRTSPDLIPAALARALASGVVP